MIVTRTAGAWSFPQSSLTVVVVGSVDDGPRVSLADLRDEGPPEVHLGLCVGQLETHRVHVRAKLLRQSRVCGTDSNKSINQPAANNNDVGNSNDRGKLVNLQRSMKAE